MLLTDNSADRSSAPLSSADLAREWTRHQWTVHAFIGSLVYRYADIEDLFQETAAQVFEHGVRYNPAQPFLPWAMGIARNVVLMHRRGMARDRDLFEAGVVDHLEQEFIQLSPAREDMVNALLLCRDGLSDGDQRLCRLRYEEGLAPQEIADRMGTCSRQVRVWLHRVRRSLRDCVRRRMRREGGAA